eukprot:14624277-Alexandrium_andersonii.AAC.1
MRRPLVSDTRPTACAPAKESVLADPTSSKLASEHPRNNQCRANCARACWRQVQSDRPLPM